MEIDSIYIIQNGRCYILVEPDKLGREKQNLRLTIQLARERMQILHRQLQMLDETSDEYDALQEEINTYETLVSDAENRFEDLLNIPAVA